MVNMKRLVELNLEDGSTILIEAEAPESEGEMILYRQDLRLVKLQISPIKHLKNQLIL